MKRIFRAVPFFAIAVAILFFSCEKDQVTASEPEMNVKVLDIKGHFVKGDSIRQLNKNLDLFLRARFEQNNSSLTEDITSNTYGFTISTNRILQLVGENYTNYIFSVYRTNATTDILENYMLTVFDTGNYMQVLVAYPMITNNGILEPSILGATVTYINDASLLTGAEMSPCTNIADEIIGWDANVNCIYINCSAGGEHSYGESCEGSPSQQPSRVCNGGWVTTGCMTSGGVGGAGPSEPTGGGTFNPDDPDDEVEEVPIIPIIPAWQEVANCMNTASFNGNIQLTSAMISWLQTYNPQAVNIMNGTLKEYSCSEEAQEDIFEEINGLMENEFIETTFDHFAVDELTNNCLLRVVRDEIINNLNANIINEIRNGLGQQASYILAFRHNNINNGNANAGTAMPDEAYVVNGQYPIIVNFADDYLANNPTKLSLAVTTIHEMVHGQLIYLYYEGELLQKYPNFTDLKSKFDIYIANRSEVNRLALEDSMHVSMVDLIGSMSYALYKYAKDNRMNNVTHQYCIDITKGTFSGTPAMNIITPDVNLQTDYILKAQNEQNNTPDAKGKDC